MNENRIISEDAIQLQTREMITNVNSNQDKEEIRSSPSFNSDSEPPSYFEALGLPQTHILTTTIGLDSKESNFSQSIPTIFIQNPQHQRHHYIRTEHLPASVYTNNNNNNNNNMNSSSNILKPSETYLVWSVFTTIYCVILGVIALVLSIQVYHLNKEENYEKAYIKSKLCRNLNVAGLFFGIVYLAIGVLVVLIR